MQDREEKFREVELGGKSGIIITQQRSRGLNFSTVCALFKGRIKINNNNGVVSQLFSKKSEFRGSFRKATQGRLMVGFSFPVRVKRQVFTCSLPSFVLFTSLFSSVSSTLSLDFASNQLSKWLLLRQVLLTISLVQQLGCEVSE